MKALWWLLLLLAFGVIWGRADRGHRHESEGEK